MASGSSGDDDDVEEAGIESGRESLRSRDEIVDAGEGSESGDSVGGWSGEDGCEPGRGLSKGFGGVLEKGRKKSGTRYGGSLERRDSGVGRRGKRSGRNLRGDEDEIEDEEDRDEDVQAKKRSKSRAVEEHDEDEANADLSLRIVAKAEELWSRKAQAPYRNARERKVVTNVSASGARGLVENTQLNAPGGSENGKGLASDRSRIDSQSKLRSESPEDGELQDGLEGTVVLALEPMADAAEMGRESSNGPEEGELLERADGNRSQAVQARATPVADDSSSGKSKKSKKKKKKKSKAERRGEPGQEKSQDGAEELADEGKNRVVENSEQATEVDGTAEQSLVMRRLLRGPRYFDPPEDQEISCFNCGKVGHLAASCPDGPRVRPCYVCGAFGHDGRACPQKTDCFICGTAGHIAKNCPNKASAKSASKDGNRIICLKCGRSGHEVPNCHYSYDDEDIAQVQCYVCNEFGHLCCVSVVDTSPAPASCYNCGEMGHTGVGCARPRRNDRDASADKGPVSVCFKCGEEGHFARGCSKRRPSWPWSQEKPRGRYFDDDRINPFSASRLPRWMDLERREQPVWSRVDTTERWMGGSSRLSFGSSRGPDSPAAFGSDKDVDSYMGPIENFISPSHGSHRKRVKRSWSSARAR